MTKQNKFGIDSEYESGEMIFIGSNAELNITSKSSLILIGPLEKNSKKVILSPTIGNNNKNYYEFYVISEGTYKIESEQIETSILITPHNNLEFHQEFGIFSAVVVILVLIMARKYLKKRAQ